MPHNLCQFVAAELGNQYTQLIQAMPMEHHILKISLRPIFVPLDPPSSFRFKCQRKNSNQPDFRHS